MRKKIYSFYIVCVPFVRKANTTGCVIDVVKYINIKLQFTQPKGKLIIFSLINSRDRFIHIYDDANKTYYLNMTFWVEKEFGESALIRVTSTAECVITAKKKLRCFVLLLIPFISFFSFSYRNKCMKGTGNSMHMWLYSPSTYFFLSF
jgi:hypothetical protein